MCRVVLFLMVMFSGSLFAQVRVSTLVIRPHQVYTLNQSDILVADTLVMMDSSTLVLNKLKPENYLRVKVARFGNHCTIDGKGVNGTTGRDGLDGILQLAHVSTDLPERMELEAWMVPRVCIYSCISIRS